jgi:hypothetical protein
MKKKSGKQQDYEEFVQATLLENSYRGEEGQMREKYNAFVKKRKGGNAKEGLSFHER